MAMGKLLMNMCGAGARSTASTLLQRIRRSFPTYSYITTSGSNVSDYFHFERAIVGSPNSITQGFAAQSLRIQQPEKEINLEKAKQQHSVYVSELKKLIPTVIEVPADHRFPDQIYVEEPAVVLNGVAMLTNMAPPSRAGEIEPMRKVLETMNMQIEEMNEPGAYLDGGDVMFTGREFFVGLSERTNKAGIERLARAFPDWPVAGIKVGKGILHLKSMCSVAGVNILAISNSEGGKRAWKDIEANGTYRYNQLLFPDDNGANCLFVNGVILHPAKEEYPNSYPVWKTLDCPTIEVPNSEFAKSDGSLTCNSIRIFEV